MSFLVSFLVLFGFLSLLVACLLMNPTIWMISLDQSPSSIFPLDRPMSIEYLPTEEGNQAIDQLNLFSRSEELNLTFEKAYLPRHNINYVILGYSDHVTHSQSSEHKLYNTIL